MDNSSVVSIYQVMKVWINASLNKGDVDMSVNNKVCWLHETILGSINRQRQTIGAGRKRLYCQKNSRNNNAAAHHKEGTAAVVDLALNPKKIVKVVQYIKVLQYIKVFSRLDNQLSIDCKSENVAQYKTIFFYNSSVKPKITEASLTRKKRNWRYLSSKLVFLARVLVPAYLINRAAVVKMLSIV